MRRLDAAMASPEVWTLSASGRAGRADYVRSLYASLLAFGLAFLVWLSADRHPLEAVRWTGYALALTTAIASLWHAGAATARRLRDAGRSPWLAFVSAVPGINLMLFVWSALLAQQEGEAGECNAHRPEGVRLENSSVREQTKRSMPASVESSGEEADAAQRLWLALKLAAADEPPSVQVQLRVRYRAKLEKLVKSGQCDAARAAELGRRMMTEPFG